MTMDHSTRKELRDQAGEPGPFILDNSTVVELLDALDEAEQEVEHYLQLAIVDVGANNQVSWKDRCIEAERKLAEARERVDQWEPDEMPINKETSP